MSAEIREYKQYYRRRELYPYVSAASAEGVAAGLQGLEGWSGASLRKTPMTIHDINGRPLFLDYRVVGREGDVGYVRAAASKVLGTPVVARIAGARQWSYQSAVEKLTPVVEKQHPDWKTRNVKLVCYSYPKLGVMFTMADENGEAQRLIFDVADHKPIAIAAPGEDTEGAVAWSFYDSLPEGNRVERLERLGAIEDTAMALPGNVTAVLNKEIKLSRINVELVEVLPLFQTTQLQFCPHYDHNEERSHHCFILHGQQVNDYCAVATCQMILCYYRYYYTQNQIAPALGYHAGGGCPSDQSPGYESLSDNHIDATFDNSPTWEKARDQINDLRPLKSGIPGHARACAGVSRSFWIGGSKSLYIYDPWPWNADYKLGGSVYWEDWDSIAHTNFIYTELQY